MSGSRWVVSLGSGHPRHAAGLARLSESLDRGGFDGRRELWGARSWPEGCPSHSTVPFAFKPWCLEAARQSGAELVLWLDASCVIRRPVGTLFGALERRGYLLFRNQRRMLGTWAADDSLAALEVPREEALAMPELNAAAIGLDLRNPLASEFLARWLSHARERTAFTGALDWHATREDELAMKHNTRGRASTDPRVLGHRHDQTVAGVLAHRMGIRPQRAGVQGYPGRPWLIRRSTTVVVDRELALDPGGRRRGR